MGKELALYVDIICIQGQLFVEKINIVVGKLICGETGISGILQLPGILLFVERFVIIEH